MNSIQAMLYRSGTGSELNLPIDQNKAHLRPVMELAKHFAQKFAELAIHTMVAERHFAGSLKGETGIEVVNARSVVFDLGAGRAPSVTFVAGDLRMRIHATTEIIERCCAADDLCAWCACEASRCGMCDPALASSVEGATS